jgi:serralysin
LGCGTDGIDGFGFFDDRDCGSYLRHVETIQFADQSIPVPSGNNAIVATLTNGNDTLQGTSGNDSLAGRGGNDVIEGAAGADALLVPGVRSAWSLSTSGGVTTIRRNGCTACITRASGIERIIFADIELDP